MEGLRELTTAVDRISGPLRVVVFFLMTVGFILKIKKAEFAAEAVLPILASSVMILGFITSQDWWFKQTQDVFFTIAHQINADYEAHPYKSIESLKEAKQAQEQKEGFGHLIKNIKASLLASLLDAFMYILMALASGIQVIFVCIYSILVEVFRLLFPLALACYQFDSLRSLGFNFVSKLLSVMAWPVGFALIERMAQSLQAHFYHSNSAFDTLHGGIFFPVLVAILVIGGTLITPLLMSSLFAAGDISGSATGFARTAIGALQGVRGITSRNLIGSLSRLGSMHGLAKAGIGAVALPKGSTNMANAYYNYSNTKPVDSEIFTASNSQKPLDKETSQIKFPKISSRVTEGDDLTTNKPLNAYTVSKKTVAAIKKSLPSLADESLSSGTLSQTPQSFNSQNSLPAYSSLPKEKAANLNSPQNLTERKISQAPSNAAAPLNVGKNNENNANKKISAPPCNGFNTPTKKPRGAATLNFNNVSYTTKAHQIADSVDKNNTLLFV
jgi:hypothetical protein